MFGFGQGLEGREFYITVKIQYDESKDLDLDQDQVGGVVRGHRRYASGPALRSDRRPNSPEIRVGGSVLTLTGGTSAIRDPDPTDPQRTAEIPLRYPCGGSTWTRVVGGVIY